MLLLQDIKQTYMLMAQSVAGITPLLTLYVLNFSEGTKTYIHILCQSSIFI